MTKTARIILASASPRRKQLLTAAKIPLRVIPSHLAEPPPGPLDPVTYTRKLALAKARLVARKVGSGLILAADTVVVHRGRIIGKPADFAQGVRILKALQGTTHQVVTGVALVDASAGTERTAHSRSFVTLRKLGMTEISRYARKHQDKAGAYAAQERKDPVVLKVKGSFTNVVGLPMEVVKKLLKEARR